MLQDNEASSSGEKTFIRNHRYKTAKIKIERQRKSIEETT
jgi:hypothetical protein